MDALGVQVTDDGVRLDNPFSMDVLRPGIVVHGDGPGPLYGDQSGTELVVRRDAEAYAADGGLGVLMLHFHNRVGLKAQVVAVLDRPV